MSLRCKKSDLAIVLNGCESGAIVRVVDWAGDLIRSDGLVKNVWYVEYRGQTHDSFSGNRWACQDINLLPIRPGDLKETEETEKEVESVVS